MQALEATRAKRGKRGKKREKKEEKEEKKKGLEAGLFQHVSSFIPKKLKGSKKRQTFKGALARLSRDLQL